MATGETGQIVRIQRDLAVELGSSSDIDRALAAVLAAALLLDGVDACGVYLVDPASREVYLAAHRGLSDAFVVGHSRFGATSTQARLVVSGAPLHLTSEQLAALTRPHEGPSETVEGLRAVAMFPIVHRGEVIGCLNAASRSAPALADRILDGLEAITSQVGGAIARIEAEATYRGLVETTATGYVILDLAGRVIDANPEYVRLSGHRTLAEIRGRSVLEWTAPEQVARNRREVERCVAEGHVRDLEIEYVDAAGRRTPLEVNATTVPAPGGARILSICRDISERRAGQEALRRSEARYRAIVENASDAILVHDRDGVILDANARAEQMTGCRREDVIGRRIHEFGRPERVEALLARLVADGAIMFEGRFRRSDGVELPVNVTARVVSREGRWQIHSATRDISELRRAEEARRTAEERERTSSELLHAVFENAMDGILLAHAGTRRFHSGNRRMCALLGCTPAELSTLSVDDIHPREALAAVTAQFEQQTQHGGVATDVPVLRRDGTVFHADINSSAITVDGAPYLLGLFRDVTERRAREAEIQKRERLESIGLLAGGIAHDFNNMLTGITGNVSLARTRLAHDPDTDLLLGEAERAASRASELTRQLLTFAKGGMPVRRCSTVADLIREAVTFPLRGSAVKPCFALPAELWPVAVDRGQIGQVLQNLAINAAQAMPAGGALRIAARNVVLDGRGAPPLPAGRYVCISVADEGCGIPTADRERIFDPYFTTKETGSGLGLAIAFSIVSKHEGYLSVDSEVGVGSTFHVHLPAAAGPSDDTPTRLAARRELPRRRVLVMDDDELVREVAHAMLQALGQSVTTAADGAEALRLFAEAVGRGEPFDLVVLDLTVAGGMGGLECYERLRATAPDARVVVTSGYSNAPVMADYERRGLLGALAKPFRLEELAALLARV